MSDYPDRANSVTYEGPIYFRGGKAEVRHIAAGNAVCDARMRVSKKFGEEWESVFFTVTAWDDTAQALAKVGNKDEVIVTGRLSIQRGYTTRDGVEHPAELAIVATDVQALESAGVGSNATDSTDWSDVPF